MKSIFFTILGFLIFITAGLTLKQIYFQKLKWKYYVFWFSLCIIILTCISFILFSWIFGENTIYAPEYSEQKFDNLKEGLTTEEVWNVLGSPLMIYEINKEGRILRVKQDKRVSFPDVEEAEYDKEKIHTTIWCYTIQGTPSSDYHERKVIFSKEGEVIKVVKSFYID